MPVRQSCGHPVDIQPEQEQNGILMAQFKTSVESQS